MNPSDTMQPQEPSLPPPLPVALPDSGRQRRGFPWGFASLLIALNFVVLFYMIFILPKFQDIYMQLGRTLPLTQRILVKLEPFVLRLYFPFGLLLNGAVLAGLILVYRRGVMATPWRRWALLAIAFLVLGMSYITVANLREGLSLIVDAQNKAYGR